MSDGVDLLEPGPLEPIEAPTKKRSPLPWVLGVVAVLALVVGVVVVASDGGSDDTPLELLSAVPDAARDEGSARVTMTMSFGGDPSTGLDGEGVVDFETGASSFEISSAGFEIDVLTDGETAWVQLPSIGLDGPSWVEVPADAMVGQGATGIDSATSVLDALREVGAEVEEVGVEEINGVSATHYSSTIDLAVALAARPGDQTELEGAIEELGDLADLGFPIDVWLTDDGLPVRIVLSFVPPTGAAMGDDVGMTMQVDFSDFGVPVEIVPPDPADVRTVEDLGELGPSMFGGNDDVFDEGFDLELDY